MKEQSANVILKTGLQARQAALFVQQANRFVSDIFLEKENKKVNAKSIMGIMSLAIAPGTEVKIEADGVDEEEAIQSLIEMIEKED